MSVLQHQTLPPLWSHLQKTDDGWLEFVISQWGIEQWRQHLNQLPQPAIASSSWPIQAAWLWQLQSGYELCCRWQIHCQQQGLSVPIKSNRISWESFLIPNQSIQVLIYCLLDICDNWENSEPKQLVQQARRLVMALETCIATARLSSEVKVLSAWLEPTRIVLEQLLIGRLGHQLAKQL
ncbi:MAG: hypothetical protein AAGI69_10720 [Cyanobacteria bacterium P01_H01_bin.21]